MKLLGACLILIAGYLTGNWILRPEREHIDLLMEGIFLFRILDSGIRYQKETLPDLLGQLAERTDSLWNPFFYTLKDNMDSGTDMDIRTIFSGLLQQYPGKSFTPEELSLFTQLGASIFVNDPELLADSIKRIADEIDRIAASLRQQLSGKAKAVRIFCISVSLLIIIILL